MDGTLIEAWAGQKSFQRKEGPSKPPEDGGSNPTVNFHGEQRRNDTHRSSTDPEAMLYRKSSGSESKLCFLGHVLMENRNGFVVDTRLTRATGTAERGAALDMAARILGGTRRVTAGGDKNYDTRDFVSKLREAAVTPHVAQNRHARRSSAFDNRCGRNRLPTVVLWIKPRTPKPPTCIPTTSGSDMTTQATIRAFISTGLLNMDALPAVSDGITCFA